MTKTKYKTKKRKANVGERILITDKSKNEQQYKNGEIFEVSKVCSGYVRDPMGVPIFDYEYEVIVGEYTSTPNLYEMGYDELVTLSESVMKALRTRSYKLGYDQGRFDEDIEASCGKHEKSDQQKRDEVVEKAKEDVRELYYIDYVGTTDFIINAEKRTVVALRKSKFYGHIKNKGIAKCAPDDCFNEHIGKAIALRRALGLEVPSEYLNVRQPTEVRVGDVVRGRTAFSMRTYEEKVEKIEDGKYKYIRGEYDFINDVDLVIIDDSRAGEGE